MIGLLLLKHIYGCPMRVCERWVTTLISSSSPAKSFSRHLPHERSDLSHWRKRLGDKLELLLAESLRVAHAAGAYAAGPQAVTVDTTVQPKAITFPTMPSCCMRPSRGSTAGEQTRRQARQSYVASQGRAMMAGRYAHAKQFKRHSAVARPAQPLGRIIRDIRRKIEDQPTLERCSHSH